MWIPAIGFAGLKGERHFSQGVEMKRGWFLGVLFLALVASENHVDAKEGFYLGGKALYNIIDGDFDGSSGPETDNGPGFGLILGYQFTSAFSLQLDLNVSRHDASVVDGAPVSDAEYDAILLGFKQAFITDRPVRPFFRAGVGLFSFTIEDPFIGDLELSGNGFEFGLGIDYYLSESFSIGAAVNRRFVDYDEFEIDGISGDFDRKISGDTTSLDLAFTAHF